MKQIPIAPQQDFLERIGNASSINAVSELIWNSLDAGASTVQVYFQTNQIDGLECVEIVDNGSGIDGSKVEDMFGDLGDSWKRKVDRKYGRTLHGKNGEGRFKAFAIGNNVTWETTYHTPEGKAYTYTISGYTIPTICFAYSEPHECFALPGTKVKIQEITKEHGALLCDKTVDEFAKVFANYLCKNPNVSLIIDGVKITPSEYLNVVDAKTLPKMVLPDGKEVNATVEIIEWKNSIPREINLCDASGIELHSIEAKLRAKGLNFTIHIKSDYFRELDKENRLLLEELDPAIRPWVEESREFARGYFRRRRAEEQREIVQRWKAEKIYPYSDRENLSPVEIAERQVFDIIGVNVEDFLPDFENADVNSKKFTFRLLAQAIKNNPESLQTIITEVLNLKKEHQEELAELLTKTDLVSIIKSAKTVTNRLDFITGLENLLFDKETKADFLERDQLHKLLENEAWIFDENFTLSVSEAKLEEVLKIHLAKLGKRSDDEGPVLREGGKQGRVDLMLSLSNHPRQDEVDHLVVELKRPQKKIDVEVISQIESYAIAVANDPRFDKNKTHWKFLVVSNEMDEYAKSKARQRDRKPGLVHDDAENNIQVWAFTWAELFHNARAKLEFINKSLCYMANRDSSKQYLTKTYQKFIPSKILASDVVKEKKEQK